MKSPAVPSLIREINERRALEVLRTHGALHAAEIARHVGLSRTTTSEILRDLVEMKLVQEFTPGEDDSKRAKLVYEAITDVNISLAIDIGARFIRAAIGDLNSRIRAEEFVAMKNHSLSEIFENIELAASKALKDSGFKRRDIISICVAAPGIIQRNGIISIAGAIPSLDGVDLASFFREEFGIEPQIENDVNMLTVAEQINGHGKGVMNFAVLSIGSGLGAGLVLNGELHRGHSGAAGEVFWVPFGNPSDNSRGDANPSGDSIADLARTLRNKFRKKFEKSILSEPFTMIEIVSAAKANDLLGKAIIEEEAKRISLYIGAIAAVTDVEIVVLSGGIGRQAGFFLEPIINFVNNYVPIPPKIVVSDLGADAILVGALQIATYEACEKSYSATRKNFNKLSEIS